MVESSKIINHPLTFLMDLWKPIKYLKFLGGHSYKKMLDLNDELIDYVKMHIEEHRKTINFESEPRDYIDAFLIEQKKQNPKMEKYGEWSDLQLIGTLLDLFAAGTDTTSSTITMFIFNILHNQNIQKQIHEEIDSVLGKEKIITMSDQTKLPYFNACLQEIQRITTLLPLNLFHRTVENIEIDGYKIPKGTTIIPQFESVHKDENEFNGKIFVEKLIDS
uniref:Cytochrome P450 n=1 Tax=Panagrolaimus davidi TaxID=227884 RepID=A0A914PZL5_9BILA